MRPRFVVLIAIAVLSTACGSEKKVPPRAAIDPPAVAKAPPAPKPAPREAGAVLSVSEDIRQACGLQEPRAYFAYDSAKLLADDQQTLKQLARCFTTGPLQDRAMRLVGHTDPRGSTEYNHALGEQRAAAVKTAMRSFGVAGHRMTIVSRGKLDAAGSDEKTWAKDRRVEASLL